MTHGELLEILTDIDVGLSNGMIHKDAVFNQAKALRAVVESHNPYPVTALELCLNCKQHYPCSTIQMIEKALA